LKEEDPQVVVAGRYVCLAMEKWRMERERKVSKNGG
jgi:hypothetical protein